MEYELSKEPLLTASQIEERVQQLGLEISSQFQVDLVIGVLTGSFIFVADLVRCLPNTIQVRFIKASSYGCSQQSSGSVKISSLEELDLKNKKVLVIDDILDTGRTLSCLLEQVRLAGANIVKSAVLLDKPSRREVSIEADFVGFSIENHFVVGYGLDYAEGYRSLPAIYKMSIPSP